MNYVGNSYYLLSDKGYEKILWKIRGYKCVERLRTNVLNYTTPPVITGFEQLSSSICCRGSYGWPKFALKRQIMPFLKFWIRPKTVFLTHNFGYRYASKSIQGSINADFDLVFNKTLSQKNGPMGWGPGPAKGGQNFQNMPSLWRRLQKSPHRKRITFFSILTTRLAESVDGLDSSLAHSPGELQDCKALQDLGLSQDWKG